MISRTHFNHDAGRVGVFLLLRATAHTRARHVSFRRESRERERERADRQAGREGGKDELNGAYVRGREVKVKVKVKVDKDDRDHT